MSRHVIKPNDIRQNSLREVSNYQVIITGLALGIITIMTLAPVATSAERPTALKQRSSEFLKSEVVSFAKPTSVMTQLAQDYFNNSANDTLRFWVFFTDKGPNATLDLSQMQANKQSAPRRAKVGRVAPCFLDLSVEETYMQEVEKLGATRLSVSRWLNAGAFSVDANNRGIVSAIAELPFTLEIRPSARAVRPGVKLQRTQDGPDSKDDSDAPSLSPLATAQLNYGSSLAQLAQIGATVGHDSGYTGEGVTLAMFDTGFRTSHQAFAIAYAENRILGEWDFVHNDPVTSNQAGDISAEWSHGTATWSAAGALFDGQLYGPAYKSNFIIAKTENYGLEIMQEEYDWVSALEWADSLGADVVSSSLAYVDWYVYSDFDGLTAITTVAANLAADMGIVVCNAMGNAGPSTGSLNAPADAFDILSCGAVDSKGLIAGFSARGPTADGRIKPEVCARGVSTYCANSGSDIFISQASGTSLSTPLIAGVTAQLIQARPNFPPRLIIRALKETASQSDAPDNSYGYGVINLAAALEWGVNFTIDGQKRLALVTEPNSAVTFADVSELTASSWDWNLGDGSTSTIQNPTHQYSSPGVYDLSLGITTTYGPFSRTKPRAIVVQADTLSLRSDSAYAGQSLTVSVALHNTLALSSMQIPLDFSNAPLTFDSVTSGLRTPAFNAPTVTSLSVINKTVTAVSSAFGADLAAGDGEVMRFYFTVDELTVGGTAGTVEVDSSESASLTASGATYPIQDTPAQVNARYVMRGDSDNNGRININDAVVIIHWLFTDTNPPFTMQSGDANADLQIIIDDVMYLINYIFSGGPPPPSP